MKATNWEFTNRALVFGMIIGVSFGLYAIDPTNVTAQLANWVGPRYQVNSDTVARLVLCLAALLLALAALLRTWASAYLHATVVYASHVKTASLVADGPYRHVRNPLYFANVLMAISMGSMMSLAGFITVTAAMLVFCYRLIFREEDELRSGQAGRYQAYCQTVPRLWPSIRARVAASGTSARWTQGFKAESWYWGFAVGVAAFAFTFNLPVFFATVGASILLFWISSKALAKSA